jgi:hypothetical protein
MAIRLYRRNIRAINTILAGIGFLGILFVTFSDRIVTEMQKTNPDFNFNFGSFGVSLIVLVIIAYIILKEG